MRLFKGGGSDEGSSHGGGRRTTDGGFGGGGGGRREDGKLMSKAKALLQTAAAPLSARGRERATERPFFDPEEHISEKREWARRYTQSQTAGSGGGSGGGAAVAATKPDRLFEHFAVVGLSPTLNIRAVAADIKTFQRVAREAGAAAASGLHITADTPREEKQRQYGLKGPAHQAEVLHAWPPLAADLGEGLPAFCFPHGVRPELLERTPSMSGLNEVIYSQPYQTHDDHSFVFLMKVADPGSVAPRTLYGVCCYVRELVHRPPSMAREAYPGCNAPLSRYLVVAPRCYCFLTHHPFFALHFRVLQTLLGLERLERMTSFAAELAALELGGGGGEGTAATTPRYGSSALTSSSSRGGGSTVSLSAGASVSGGTSGPAGSAAAAAAVAAGAVAAGAAEAEEEQDSEASSRWWTEGSSAAAADEVPPQQQQQQGGDLAALMLELSMAEQQQGQQQQQQGQQRARPSRLAQVSPHCPAPAPAEGEPEGRAGREATPADAPARGAAEADAAAFSTPHDQLSSSGAAVGPTPFFTPAGISSAVGTPSRSATAQLSPVSEEVGGTRRALDESLSAADVGGSSHGGDDAAAAVAAAVAAGSRPSSGALSRPGSRQRQQDGDDVDGSGSDAESYRTASSSTALLTQQLSQGLEASPATASAVASALRAQQQQQGGSASGVCAASIGPAPPLPPLLDLEGEEEQQQLEQQQRREAPPLLDLSEVPQLQQEQLEHGQRAVWEQEEAGSGEAGPEAAAPAERLGSGALAVHIETRSVSASPDVGGTGRADARPRADVLGSTSLSRSMRLQLVEGASGDGSSEQQLEQQQQGAAAATHQQAQQQQAQQQQQQGTPAAAAAKQQQQEVAAQQTEVVRVTAPNLDTSRPLRSADLLAVYYASVVPRPGQVFEFQPDPGLQTIAFERPDVVEAVQELGLRPNASSLPDIDAAQNLGGWAVAALCRSMSLDNLLTFLTAALLERQIVVFCPNAGLLSGIVLSLVPLLLPFHWQSLLLPVLPAAEGRLELMEAPVPFVLGVLYKTPEVRAKCGGLVRVNVYKDKVKNAGAGLPALPQAAALQDALAGTYAELRKIGLTRTATTRPVHMISDAQQVLAECFLSTLQKYLRGMVADLRAYCITDVSPSMERTSVLLKDSFVDSFPPRDRPFMRQFAETQMFSVYTDAVLG